MTAPGRLKPAYRRVAAFVRLHARRRPDHVAVMRGEQAITYAALDLDLRAMSAALAGLGLDRGAIVAISHEDLYVQLLLIFGFESLGVASASFRASEGEDCHGLLRRADLVMSQADPPTGLRRFFRLTDDWIAAALAEAAPAPPPPLPALADDAAVLFRSSGTTGRPKMMLLTQRMLATRLAMQRQKSLGLGLDRRSRFLAAMHFSVGSTYMAARNCLCLGTTFMFDGKNGVLDTATQQPTHMTMLPFQLRALLGRLPEAGAQRPRWPGLTLQTIGAKLPEDLRRDALLRLCGRTLENYGSNEAGTIGVVDETDVLLIAEGVQAEVVDDEGRVLPPRRTGALRVKSAAVVAGYMDSENAPMFRGGWFYPGDLAFVEAPGRLRLAGRDGDVLNLGGLKVASAEIEHRLQSQAGLRDVAVLQRDKDIASSPVTVFVVADAGMASRRLPDVIFSIINFPFELRVVSSIPRTAEGKIKRSALQDLLITVPSVTAEKLRHLPANA